MEKITTYETIILNVLGEYADYWNSNNGPIKNRIIVDREQRSYQLIRIGWMNDFDYIHSCIFHIDIIDEKVWIQQNTTDVLIAEELVAAGIPKLAIVLGVLPPQVRVDSDYAAA